MREVGQAKLRLGAEEGELISSMAVAVLRMNVDPRIRDGELRGLTNQAKPR